MIEQIIEKFENKFGGYEFTFNNPVTLKENIADFIRSEFSSYNKQLLDGIEGDIREMPTKTIHETLDYVNKEATLLAVNKYRV